MGAWHSMTLKITFHLRCCFRNVMKSQVCFRCLTQLHPVIYSRAEACLPVPTYSLYIARVANIFRYALSQGFLDAWMCVRSTAVWIIIILLGSVKCQTAIILVGHWLNLLGHALYAGIHKLSCCYYITYMTSYICIQ